MKMMVRLVSCGVIESRQAGSNRWIREREIKTITNKKRMEEQSIV